MTTIIDEPFADTGCPWTVRVPSGHPEDLWTEQDCGAPVTMTHEGRGWACEAGHSHVPIEVSLAPFGPEWEHEQKERHDA